MDIGHRGFDLTVVDGKKIRIELAPGLRLSNARLYQVRHNAVLAQAARGPMRSRRSMAGLASNAGPADNLATAVPAIETPREHQVAARSPRLKNEPAGYLTVIISRENTPASISPPPATERRHLVFTAEELKIISSPVDFVGLNIYRSPPPMSWLPAGQADSGRYRSQQKSHPRIALWWHLLGPES